MPRLFAAIPLPDDVRSDLADLNVPLPGAAWVDEDDLHITLRFAGDIDNRQANEFQDALAHVDGVAFEARIRGLGVFGGSQPRTLWAGIDAGPELEALARAVERAARNAGLKPEPRAFKAHVTLARLKHVRPEEVARVLQALGAVESAPFVVDRFVLYSAKPIVGGGPYVAEDEFLLAGAAYDYESA